MAAPLMRVAIRVAQIVFLKGKAIKLIIISGAGAIFWGHIEKGVDGRALRLQIHGKTGTMAPMLPLLRVAYLVVCDPVEIELRSWVDMATVIEFNRSIILNFATKLMNQPINASAKSRIIELAGGRAGNGGKVVIVNNVELGTNVSSIQVTDAANGC